MAENVEMRAERAIPDYEMMRTLKIFDVEEIKGIIKQRERHEYLLARKEKQLIHYLEYIRYERELLSLITERKHANVDIKLEQSLLQKIRNLYVQAALRFPSVDRLWDQYFIFMVKSKFTNPEIAAVLEQMLQFHSNKPTTWLKYIKWERNENKNENKCRNLLLRATQQHPECIQLYLEFFDLELTNSKQQAEDIVLQHVTVLYNNARKKIPDIEVMVTLLDKVTSFSYTEPLQIRMLEDFKSMHCTHELFWHTIAQRELTGKVTYKKSDDGVDVQVTDPTKRTLKARIQNCAQVYKAAITELDTERMWSMYLDSMLKLNLDLSTQAALKRKVLGQAFNEADEANRMTENYYLQYFEIMYATDTEDETVIKIIQRAITRYPDSIPMWQAHMRHHIRADNIAGVQEVFNQARKKLATKSYPLWNLYLGYLSLTPGSNELIRDVYENALNEVNPVFSELKAKYIEWVGKHLGLKQARYVYRQVIKSSNVCLEIHQKMAELESYQVNPDINAWRYCLETAAIMFGKDRTDVWLQYIDFELTVGDPKNVGKIAERAIGILKPELVDSFTSEREMIQLGMISL